MIELLAKNFKKINKQDSKPFEKYKGFDFVRDYCYKGSGQVDNGGYLILWDADELELINDEYCVDEFLTDVFLIGSDGCGNAYGTNIKGEYITVPFIVMDDSDVTVIGKTFEEFIKYVANLT